MKIKISGVKPVIENIPEMVEEVELISNEVVDEPEENIEETESDEEESDADFQYNNSGIYFRNGIEIEFCTAFDDISVRTIKFPNDIAFVFECDEEGNLKGWKQISEE